MGRLTFKLAAALGAVGGVMAMTAVPAAAHDYCAENPPDPSTSCVRFNHTQVDVCDRHADGHRVYAHFNTIYSGTNQFYTTGYDLNDSQSGCTPYGRPWYDNTAIIRVQTCIQFEGCGAWRWHP